MAKVVGAKIVEEPIYNTATKLNNAISNSAKAFMEIINQLKVDVVNNKDDFSKKHGGLYKDLIKQANGLSLYTYEGITYETLYSQLIGQSGELASFIDVCKECFKSKGNAQYVENCDALSRYIADAGLVARNRSVKIDDVNKMANVGKLFSNSTQDVYTIFGKKNQKISGLGKAAIVGASAVLLSGAFATGHQIGKANEQKTANKKEIAYVEEVMNNAGLKIAYLDYLSKSGNGQLSYESMTEFLMKTCENYREIINSTYMGMTDEQKKMYDAGVYVTTAMFNMFNENPEFADGYTAYCAKAGVEDSINAKVDYLTQSYRTLEANMTAVSTMVDGKFKTDSKLKADYEAYLKSGNINDGIVSRVDFVISAYDKAQLQAKEAGEWKTKYEDLLKAAPGDENLKAELARAIANEQTALRRVNTLTAENAKLGREKALLEEQYEGVLSQVQTYKTANAQLTEQLRTETAKNANIKAEAERLQTALDAANALNNAQGVTIKQQQNELTAKDTAYSKLEADYQGLNEKYNQLLASGGASSQELAALKAQLAEADARADKAEAETNAAREAYNNLVGQYNATLAENNALEEQIKIYQEAAAKTVKDITGEGTKDTGASLVGDEEDNDNTAKSGDPGENEELRGGQKGLD